MGLFSQIKEKFTGKATRPTESDRSNSKEMITVYDSYGREMQVSKNEWRTKVLPGNIKDAWNSPDDLYAIIVQSLNDGFSSDMLKPSERLLEIDQNKERGVTIHGIVLMKNHKLDAAENLLKSFLDKNGASGVVLTNLAKVYAEKEDHEKSESVLWDAIEADPNLDNGLEWMAAIHSERSGNQGYLDVMNKVSEMEGAWRAKLWIARDYLEKKELQKAIDIYESIRELISGNHDAYMQVTGDLGRNGYVEEIFNAFGDNYSPEEHGINTGINLLQACLETEKIEKGQAVLGLLYELNRPDYKNHLDFYAQKFEDFVPKVKARKPENVEYIMMPFANPVWAYGLGELDDILPSHEREGKISIYSFSNSTERDLNEPITTTEDDAGRMTRILPALILQSLFLKTSYSPTYNCLVAKGHGAVVAGKKWDLDSISDREIDNSDFYILGDLKDLGDDWKIEIEIIGKDRKVKKIISKTTPKIKTHLLAQDVCEELLNEVERKIQAEIIKEFHHEDSRWISSYHLALNQSLLLTLTSNNVVSKDSFSLERRIYDNIFDIAINNMEQPIAVILCATAIGKAKRFQSNVISEYESKINAFISDLKKGAPMYIRLAQKIEQEFKK